MVKCKEELMYKIYEDCIKVYEDGTIEGVGNEDELKKIKPHLISSYNENLKRVRTDLVFADPKDDYRIKRRSFLPIMASLFLEDFNNDTLSYALPIDDDFTNVHLSNIKIVTQAEKLHEFYDNVATYECVDCNSTVRKISKRNPPYYVSKQCNRCYTSEKTQLKAIQRNKLKAEKEFKHIDFDKTIISEELKGIVKHRLDGKTLEQIGQLYGLTRESIRLKLNRAKEYGHFNKFTCKCCNKEYVPKTMTMIETLSKVENCLKCYRMYN